MSKSEFPPVGIEQAVEHLAHAIKADKWDEGCVCVLVDRDYMVLSHYEDGVFKDYFALEHGAWVRKEKYEDEPLWDVPL